MTDDSIVYLRRHAEILHARFIVIQNERGLTAAEEEYCKVNSTSELLKIFLLMSHRSPL